MNFGILSHSTDVDCNIEQVCKVCCKAAKPLSKKAENHTVQLSSQIRTSQFLQSSFVVHIQIIGICPNLSGCCFLTYPFNQKTDPFKYDVVHVNFATHRSKDPKNLVDLTVCRYVLTMKDGQDDIERKNVHKLFNFVF